MTTYVHYTNTCLHINICSHTRMKKCHLTVDKSKKLHIIKQRNFTKCRSLLVNNNTSLYFPAVLIIVCLSEESILVNKMKIPFQQIQISSFHWLLGVWKHSSMHFQKNYLFHKLQIPAKNCIMFDSQIIRQLLKMI